MRGLEGGGKPAPAKSESEIRIRLSHLLEQVEDVAKRDDIFLLIASGEVYLDLSAAAIVEPERVFVFTNLDADSGRT